MGFLEWIKANSRLVSDATAGTPAYFELATTNRSLRQALGQTLARHVRGRALDAGAGRQAYRSLIEPRADAYESLDHAPLAGLTDHVADLRATGLPCATYDTVVCTQVLQHLPEPADALREMARLLKPGGTLILSAPHLVWLHNEPHDYFRFTSHGLRHLLRGAGLETVSVEPVGGWICFLAYAPSNVALAASWPLRPLFHAVFALNRLWVGLALAADALVGLSGLYPTNYVAVARKPV